MSYPRNRPGTAFKNGKLYVFSRRRIIVLKGWPEMAAWTKSGGRPRWCRFRPDISINEPCLAEVRPRHRYVPPVRRIERPNLPPIMTVPLGGDMETEVEPDAELYEQPDLFSWRIKQREQQARKLIGQFFEAIPRKVRAVVERFRHRQWHLLSMSARCEGALDLLLQNPGLGFAAASNWVFCDMSSGEAMRWIRRMLPKRRREIAAALGFPCRELSARVLAKLRPEDCSIYSLLTLRDLLADSERAKLLAHAAVIDNALLTLMARPRLRRAVDHHLLWEVGQGRQLPVARTLLPGLLYHYFAMCRQIGNINPKVFCSVNSLVAEHDAVARRFIDRCEPEQSHIVFPPPPVPGTDTIMPITSLEDLIKEAREQDNCVASYARRVGAGTLYIYRMTFPERATIAVRKTRGAWSLDEISGPANARASGKATAEVLAWLGLDVPF